MMTPAEARQFRNQLNSVIENMDDETAIEYPSLFPMWAVGLTYYGPDDSDHPQSRVQHSGILYKCIITHAAQADWSPDVAVSLWVRIDDPSEEWPEWRQPTGAHDAYDLGSKVSHNNKHWISNMAANVFEPGVAGWDEAE